MENLTRRHLGAGKLIDDCTFRAVTQHEDGEPCPMPPVAPSGRAYTYRYHCVDCDRYHWAVPAAEVMGTAGTKAESEVDTDLALALAGLTVAISPLDPGPCGGRRHMNVRLKPYA